MKADADDQVEVVLDLERLGGPTRVGWLRRQRGGRTEVLSFEYDPAWLRHDAAFGLDPELSLVAGRAYANRGAFGIFRDSEPDRWGRTLMDRRAAMRARHAGKKAPALTAWDYLLGVHDQTRLGALRFRVDAAHPFLDDDPTLAAPPIASLAQLQAISLALEQGDAEEHADYEKWLAKLVAPGSSLGGARPKAAVIDEKKRLCIAKFPSRSDRLDVGGWEMVLNRLAVNAGIDVPEAKALHFGRSGHTFLSRRFDRTLQGRRMFVSAMTLLQREDGDPGASYLELVELLQTRGEHAARDSEQLFRRVVFNIATSNTDDHLRNHGFFLEAGGLVLAPAYDLNPNPHGEALTLAIDEHNSTCDFEVALDAAAHYGVEIKAAVKIVASVRRAIATWPAEAKKLEISKAQQERMRSAFRA